MDDNFENNLETFFTEMQNESLHKYHKENPDYDDLYSSYAHDSNQWKTIVDNLPQKDKDFLINFAEKNNELTGMEFDRLYQQGYKDCIRLLKYIGVL